LNWGYSSKLGAATVNPPQTNVRQRPFKHMFNMLIGDMKDIDGFSTFDVTLKDT